MVGYIFIFDNNKFLAEMMLYWPIRVSWM